MPVKSTTASTPTTPRKRRSRKTSQTATKATPKAVKKTPVAKVTVTTFKGGKVVAKKTTLKRPSTARLITPQRYVADIKTRWAIHNFEIQELISDFIKGFEAVKPYHTQFVKMVNK